MRASRTAALLVVLAATLAAAGCGRRGDPQFEPEGAARSDEPLALPKKSPPAKPKTPFLLDPLLGPRTHPSEPE